MENSDDKRDITRYTLAKRDPAVPPAENVIMRSRRPSDVPEWAVIAISRCFILPKEQFPLTIAHNDCGFKKWNFTCLDLNTSVLFDIVVKIFDEIIDQVQIDRHLFKKLVHTIFHNYPPNPYHNIHHAVDVLQCVWYIIFQSDAKVQLQSILKPTDIFSLMLAAFCHDLGHPSFSNSFIHEMNHPLRIIFNDISVLEQYHSMILFSILSDSSFSTLFDRWPVSSKIRFRKIVIACILATDMSNHFQHISKFNSMVANQGSAEIFSDDFVTQLCISVIKFADISNVCRPFEIALNWTKRLIDEFWHQVYHFLL